MLSIKNGFIFLRLRHQFSLTVLVTMKLSLILTAGLLGGANAGAIKFMENDALAAKGMANLAVHVAKNGYPAPEKCTLKNVAVRREW